MLQIALTTYLLISVAIGPALCCCAPMVMLHGVVSVFAMEHQEGAAHCPYHAALAESGEAAQPDAPRESHDRNCPCREGRASLEIASVEKASESARRSDLTSIALFIDPMSSYAGAALDPLASSFCTRAATGLSGRDILRAYQHLLC